MGQPVTRVLVTSKDNSWQANTDYLPEREAEVFAELVRGADFSSGITDLFAERSISGGCYWIVAQTDKEVLCNGWSSYADLSPSAKQVVDMTIAYDRDFPSLVNLLLELSLEMGGDLTQDSQLRGNAERHLARFMVVWNRLRDGHLAELQQAEDDLHGELASERKAAYQRWAERATK